MIWVLGAAYVIGLIYIIVGDSVVAHNPRQFWLTLVCWPIVALIGWANSILNRI